MLGLCRSSSRYSQCVQGGLVWTICARARLEALTEANEQDLAELQRLKSHDAASEWHLRSTGEWILKRELIGGCQASWWPELFLKAVVTMKAVQCLLQAPMFWPDLRKILPIWGQDVIFSGQVVDSWLALIAATEDRVKYWQLNFSARSDHRKADTRIQWVWAKPGRQTRDAEMKKAIWEEWNEWKAWKCHLPVQIPSGIDFQICWNLHSLPCFLSEVDLLSAPMPQSFQHMPWHEQALCFNVLHITTSPHLWSDSEHVIHVIHLYFLCIAHVFWRHHWCIWVWCRPSWRGCSYGLSMETSTVGVDDNVTVKADEGGTRSSTFRTKL